VSIKIWDETILVGIGLFVPRNIKRHLVIHSDTLFLNEYPFEGGDMVIEYNGLLVEKGLESEIYIKVLEYLSVHFNKVDEFYFRAMTTEGGYRSLEQSGLFNLDYILRMKSVVWQVELDKFSPGLDSYIETLSSNARAQVRRSIRLYEMQAPLKLLEASSVEEALVFFDGLKSLHMARWQSKGKRGSFSNQRWERFHRSLIKKRFDTGEIQLLKIYNSSEDIAYLFNYIWCGKVYVLQMGFNYSQDKRLKPGYVAHSLAIVHNKRKGMTVYDFMLGESRYKSSLSNNTTSLYSVVLQRRRLKFTLEKMAVRAVTSARNLVGKYG